MKVRGTWAWMLPVLLLASLILWVPKVEADLFYFDTSNVFGEWTGTYPPGYGKVEITKGLDGYIHFEITANPAFFTTTSDPGLTWDKFYFNFNDGKTLNTSLIVVDSPGTWNVVTGKNVSQFGLFDFGEKGTALGGLGIDPLKFHIADTSLLVEDFIFENADGYLFAGHLKRFDAMCGGICDGMCRGICGQTSTFLGVGGLPETPPVPEPGTLMLLGSGFLGMALMRRRSKG